MTRRCPVRGQASKCSAPSRSACQDKLLDKVLGTADSRTSPPAVVFASRVRCTCTNTKPGSPSELLDVTVRYIQAHSLAVFACKEHVLCASGLSAARLEKLSCLVEQIRFDVLDRSCSDSELPKLGIISRHEVDSAGSGSGATIDKLLLHPICCTPAQCREQRTGQHLKCGLHVGGKRELAATTVR